MSSQKKTQSSLSPAMSFIQILAKKFKKFGSDDKYSIYTFMKHLKLFENFSQDSGESGQPMEVYICLDSDCKVMSGAEIEFEGGIPHIVSGSYKGDLWNELPSVYDDELEEIFSVYKDAGLSVEKSRISNLSNADISYRGAGRDHSGEFTANSSSINRKLETGELRLRKDETATEGDTPLYYLEVVS